MYEYEIAISFAGEDRSIALEIVQKLLNAGVNVFYDKNEQANLWGKDLYEYLADVYSKHARYCVMIISENYEKKLWTNHERRNAQERAFREREEYILPVRLDDTCIPGIRDTIGYIDLRHTSLDELVEMILVKLGKEKKVPTDSPKQATDASFNITLPRIKKNFTQLDKDRFSKDAFLFVSEYFRKGIEKLSLAENGIDADFVEVSPLKFTAKVYRDGKLASQCKIWMGGAFSSNSICYAYSFHYINNDSSFNDWFSIEDDGSSLFLKSSMGSFRSEFTDKAMDQQLAAQYFWQRFISPLER